VLEPRNHLLKLPGEDSSVIERQADALLIARGPAFAPAHLVPHELAQRDADGRGSKPGAKSAPNFIADLYPRHPVARGCSLSRGPFSTQPRSLAHVYTYTMSPWVELCAAKRSGSDAERQGCLLRGGGGVRCRASRVEESDGLGGRTEAS